MGRVYSGREWEYAVVDSSQYSSPLNSFRLEGRKHMAQVVGRPISQAWLQEHPVIWFEARVMEFNSEGGK